MKGRSSTKAHHDPNIPHDICASAHRASSSSSGPLSLISDPDFVEGYRDDHYTQDSVKIVSIRTPGSLLWLHPVNERATCALDEIYDKERYATFLRTMHNQTSTINIGVKNRTHLVGCIKVLPSILGRALEAERKAN